MSFPNTPILDTFVRANENPLSDGGKWSSPVITGVGYNPFQIISDVAIDPFGDAESYWSASTFGPNSEVYVEVPALGGPVEFGVFLRIQNPGATPTYYSSGFETPHYWYIYSSVSGTLFLLVETAVQAGDWVGLQAIGNTLNLYRQRSGIWSLLGNATSGDIAGSGYIGMFDQSNTGDSFSNFGGGTYNPAGPPMAGGQIEGGSMETMPYSEFIA